MDEQGPRFIDWHVLADRFRDLRADDAADALGPLEVDAGRLLIDFVQVRREPASVRDTKLWVDIQRGLFDDADADDFAQWRRSNCGPLAVVAPSMYQDHPARGAFGPWLAWAMFRGLFAKRHPRHTTARELREIPSSAGAMLYDVKPHHWRPLCAANAALCRELGEPSAWLPDPLEREEAVEEILQHLAAAGRAGLSQLQLAYYVHKDRKTVGRLLERMKDRGWVEPARKSDGSQAKTRPAITPAGQQARRRIGDRPEP